MAEHLARHFAVVEIDRAVPQHLGGFMALARQKHDVSGTRLIERDFNGALPIRFHQEFRIGALRLPASSASTHCPSWERMRAAVLSLGWFGSLAYQLPVVLPLT